MVVAPLAGAMCPLQPGQGLGAPDNLAIVTSYGFAVRYENCKRLQQFCQVFLEVDFKVRLNPHKLSLKMNDLSASRALLRGKRLQYFVALAAKTWYNQIKRLQIRYK
jgi:hypothetical protein